MRSDTDATPVARSVWECHAYLAQEGCPCGATGYGVTEHTTLTRDGSEFWQYEGRCGVCGGSRRLDVRAPVERAPEYPAFGGATPSQLLDAGQFRRIAALAAQRVPAEPERLGREEFDDAYETILIAVAAMEEVLKFIPAGVSAVPRDAAWTAQSGAEYNQRPELFERRLLMAALGAYRQVAAAYSRRAG